MNGTLARSFALAAAGALAGLLVSGCGGDDTVQSDPTPTPSFSSSSTAPTSSSAPVTPSTSAAAETPEAFVRRWVSLQTKMQNSGDSASLRAVSSTCEACTGLADLVDKYYAAGGFIKTRGWSIQTLTCQSDGDQRSCTAEIENASTSYQESAGSKTVRLHGGPFTELFDLARTPSGWTMSRIAEQAS